MKEIILSNRYGVINKLVEVEENLFKLVFGNEEDEKWCRFGLRDGTDWNDQDYEFVDPSGGPYLQLGMTFRELPGMEISRIYSEKTGDNKYTNYIKFDKKK